MGSFSDKVRYFSVIVPFSSDGSQLLLGRKKRGMGEGLWNGFGGKPEKGETMDRCAHRELHEESGIFATEYACAGILYMDDTTGPNFHIPVYRVTKFTGEVAETEEMEPRWFGASEDCLPYDKMYEEARLWWPNLLADTPFVAKFLFEGEKVLSHDVQSVGREVLREHMDRIDEILL
ncbi:Nudix (Nucleoside diphosphate linked moiety X)-type motif 1, partial [Coemansia interrupta]